MPNYHEFLVSMGWKKSGLSDMVYTLYTMGDYKIQYSRTLESLVVVFSFHSLLVIWRDCETFTEDPTGRLGPSDELQAQIREWTSRALPSHVHRL